MNPFHQTFLLYFVPGILFSFIVVYLSSNLKLLYRVPLYVLSILINWASVFFGVHMGYGAWQAMPNPPDEAFADGAKLTAALFGGWIPGIFLFFAMHVTVVAMKMIQKRMFTQNQQLAD